MMSKITWGMLLTIPFLIFHASAEADDFFPPSPSDYHYGTIDPNNTVGSLNTCANTGRCNSSSVGGSPTAVYQYPMTQGGALGAAEYTGCYRLLGAQLQRYSDLDATGACACPSPLQGGACKEQYFRTFLGYRTTCPGNTATCTDGGQLHVNCRVTAIGSTSDGGNSVTAYERDCGPRAVIRGRGPAVAATPSPILPCDAGKMSANGMPPCTACPSGTFSKTQASTTCTNCAAPHPANGTTISWKTATTGSTSANDCQIDEFNCNSSFVKNMVAHTCDPAPVQTCPFTITPTASGPGNPTKTDGGISVVTSGAVLGTMSYSISPADGAMYMPSNSGVGFGGLGEKTYTITATDSGATDPSCVKTRTVSLSSTCGTAPPWCHLNKIHTRTCYKDGSDFMPLPTATCSGEDGGQIPACGGTCGTQPTPTPSCGPVSCGSLSCGPGFTKFNFGIVNMMQNYINSSGPGAGGVPYPGCGFATICGGPNGSTPYTACGNGVTPPNSKVCTVGGLNYFVGASDPCNW